MKRHLTFLALAAAVLQGCSLAPDYQRPPMPTPEAWSSQAAAPEASEAAPAAELPWQDFVADPRLREILALALDENRDLRQAALAVERARAAWRIERSDLVPSVAANASGERYRLPADLSSGDGAQTVEQYSVSLGAAWELDLFGRVRSLSESALQQYLATREARTAFQVALVAEVSSTYLALAADLESLALARETLAAQEDYRDLVRRSRDAGMGSDLELRQAESQVESARADAARLAGRIAVDRNTLALLAGAPVADRLLPDGLDAVAPFRELAAGLPSEVLLARPDVRAAEHRLEAAHANIGAARAALFPRISLTGSAGTLSADLSGLFAAGSGTWSFVPQVSVPIFRGGALHAGLRAIETEREIAVAEYEKAVQTAFAEVSNALALRSTLAEQRDAQAALVAALDDGYGLQVKRYEAGLDGYLGVLVAQRSLYAAQQGLVAVRLAESLNRVALYKVLGGGGDEAAEPRPIAEAAATTEEAPAGVSR